jgi:hypothetical protein
VRFKAKAEADSKEIGRRISNIKLLQAAGSNAGRV